MTEPDAPQAELAELQWPPLVAAQKARAAELRALAEQHARAEDRLFGRLRGASALLAALELVHCHAFAYEDEYWLLPEAAQFPRSAPNGASLERCAESGDLLVIASDADAAAADDDDDDADILPLKLIFSGLDEDDGPEGPARIGRGEQTNDELLLREGWADDKLTCDAFAMPTDVLRAAAADVLGGSHNAAEGESVVDGLRACGAVSPDGYGDVRAAGTTSDGLARAATALCLSADEIRSRGGVHGWVERLAASDASALLSPGGADAAGGATTAAAQRVLVQACGRLLDGFATSAAEDAALLATLEDSCESLSDVRRVACVRSRLSRKRCLVALQGACGG